MFSESPVFIRRLVRFMLLPHCFLRLVDWAECPRSRTRVALDFLYIFFVLRDYPDNYGPCRLWERPRSEWPLFYGSNYNPHQRSRLRKEVHPLLLELALRDKEVADGFCGAMGIRVPRTVGVVTPEQTVAQQVLKAFQSTSDTRLIVKPVRGHAGLGIMLAERLASGALVFHSQATMTDGAVRLKEKCIVQELVKQRNELNEISPFSLNTLRLLTMLSRSGELLTIGATMRFGVGGTFIDNWSAGGIAVGVDHTTGRLHAAGFDKRGRKYLSHPDTGVVFENFQVPAWAEALEFGNRVQRGFPFFRLLGMDLAFSPDGIVLIEINNDADLVFQEQTSGPLLATKKNWSAFRDYGLFYNRQQADLFR